VFAGVFSETVETISHLEEPLMECSNKEAYGMLHTPSHLKVSSIGHRFRMVLSASIRRHQESERCRAGLDSLRDISLNPLVRNVK